MSSSISELSKKPYDESLQMKEEPENEIDKPVQKAIDLFKRCVARCVALETQVFTQENKVLTQLAIDLERENAHLQMKLEIAFQRIAELERKLSQ